MATKKDKEAAEFGGATRGSIWNFDPTNLTIIGLDTKDGPDHPLYDPRIKLPLNEATVLNMMAVGVLESITVTNIDGKAVVVDGRRRVMHAREAQKRLRAAGDKDFRVTVSAKSKSGADDQLFKVMVTANTHREIEGPVAEARKADIMSKRFEYTDEQVMEAFKWSIGTLRNRRKLLTLPAKVLRQVEAGTLGEVAALKMAGMDPEEAEQLADDLSAEAESTGSTRGQSKRVSKAKDKDKDKDDRPGLRALKAYLECSKADGLDEGAAKAFRWLLGDIQAVAIKGLSACINEVNEAARERIKEKNRKAKEKADKAKADKVAAGKGKKPPTNKAEAPAPAAPKVRKGSKGPAELAAMVNP